LGVFHIASNLMKHFIRKNATMPITLEGCKAFLAAALLHDLGHFPFTHSLKELPLKQHEELTAEIILFSPIKDILRNDLLIDPDFCCAIIDENIDCNDEQVIFFRKLLSSAIDPDKLDYLNRDAWFCGIPYGSQDVDYILSVLEPNAIHGYVIDRNSIAAIEGLLFSKYLMYRAVYWHQTIRTATGMIKKSLHIALENNTIQADDLYGLDDESFYLNFARRDDPAFSLINAVYNRELFSVVRTIDFQPENPVHRSLENLDNRQQIEIALIQRFTDFLDVDISNTDILIDIPEHISFDIDIMLRDNNDLETYDSSPSVFTKNVIEQFVRSLRKIRISVSAGVAEKIHALSSIQRKQFFELSGDI
ncbi:MAG: HD domain-containing protein, partial [Salinispira sp.]